MVFACKMAVFQGRRLVLDAVSGPAALSVGDDHLPYLVGESLSALRGDIPDGEETYQDGKIHNLGRAAAALDGLVLRAGETFSFWRQIGRTTRDRGYVEGRMVQEGCLIPAVGGGLCQLSTALYGAALAAGCDILERHPHSVVVPGSTAALTGHDATVAWNYVDLRFKSARPLTLTVSLEEGRLAVRFWAGDRARVRLAGPVHAATDGAERAIRSCDTCNQTACFRHEGRR
jgi:vancomycin resistance protein YoaR